MLSLKGVGVTAGSLRWEHDRPRAKVLAERCKDLERILPLLPTCPPQALMGVLLDLLRAVIIVTPDSSHTSGSDLGPGPGGAVGSPDAPAPLGSPPPGQGPSSRAGTPGRTSLSGAALAPSGVTVPEYFDTYQVCRVKAKGRGQLPCGCLGLMADGRDPPVRRCL